MRIPPPADLLRKVRRGLRHLFLDTSYAHYYSEQVWERDYREGYNLDVPAEDARYGALVGLMARYEGDGPILDAGCGDGILEARYRPVGKALMVGIDYSETAIRRAEERNLPGCRFRHGDFRSLGGNETFSMIVYNETLYYADEPLRAMEGLAPYLAPGGVFVVSMFRTLVTARVWRRVHRRYQAIQDVSIRDKGSRLRWDIAVLDGSRR